MNDKGLIVNEIEEVPHNVPPPSEDVKFEILHKDDEEYKTDSEDTDYQEIMNERREE